MSSVNFSAATSPHIPFDVQLLILDQCQNDKSALCAFSLVCRDLLWPTRSHLFCITTIKVPHRTDEPVRHFIHALILSKTELGHNITTLRIVGSDRFTPWIQLRNPYSPMVLTIAFYPMFTCLPRLRRLSFVNVRFVTLDFAMSHFVCEDDVRPSLDYLEINSCLDDGDKANGTVNFITLFASSARSSSTWSTTETPCNARSSGYRITTLSTSAPSSSAAWWSGGRPASPTTSSTPSAP